MKPVRYTIRHETRYRYTTPVLHSQNEARIHLRSSPWQSVEDQRLTILPASLDLRQRTDFFGNHVLYFSIQNPHSEFSTTIESTVRVDPALLSVPGSPELDWRDLLHWIASQPTAPDVREARAWRYNSPRIPRVPAIHRYALDVFEAHPSLVPACTALMQRIYEDFHYDNQSTQVDTPVDVSFGQRSGVCQDFAHIMLCGLRSLGLPCRYVSGYLETQPPPGKEKLVGADATHAWISVFVPGFGWADFDPTNNVRPTAQHVTIAWGRDVSDVMPLKGVVLGGGKHRVDVFVDMNRHV